MKLIRSPILLAVGLLFGWPAATHAFPPAPHHVIYGLVRDEFGRPITVTNAFIIFEAGGVQVRSPITPYLRPGVNYQLSVPMDSGLTSDPYKRTAQRPAVSFRISVQIGNATYLPIEMTGNLASLGDPAKKTRLDLTLGEDSDRDGLPDAWERAMITALGRNLSIQGFHPGDDVNGNGINNEDHYIAGTYPFDPADGFKLDIVSSSNGAVLIDFFAVRGRAYTLFGSPDLITWSPLEFKIPAEGPASLSRPFYQSTDVRQLRIQVLQPPATEMRFFKMQVQ